MGSYNGKIMQGRLDHIYGIYWKSKLINELIRKLWLDQWERRRLFRRANDEVRNRSEAFREAIKESDDRGIPDENHVTSELRLLLHTESPASGNQVKRSGRSESIPAATRRLLVSPELDQRERSDCTRVCYLLREVLFGEDDHFQFKKTRFGFTDFCN